jgi:hypothetical protein
MVEATLVVFKLHMRDNPAFYRCMLLYIQLWSWTS